MLSLTDAIKIILHEQRSESDLIKISVTAEFVIGDSLLKMMLTGMLRGNLLGKKK